MKKLITFLTTMMVSLTVFSQNATDTIPVKCFPIPIVKEIAKDLLRGDSAISELKSVEKQLQLTEKKLSLKDSVITEMQTKENNYIKIIENQNSKYEILEGHTKKLERDLKISRVKNKFKSFVSVGVIGFLTFLLISK